MDTSDGSMDAIWSALRAAVIAVGGGFVSYGLASQSQVTIFASLVPTVAAALWGLWTAIQKARQRKTAVAVGVASGINLTLQGKALAADGSVINIGDAGAASTPPKPVSVQSAQEIVANFAPATPPKAA